MGLLGGISNILGSIGGQQPEMAAHQSGGSGFFDKIGQIGEQLYLQDLAVTNPEAFRNLTAAKEQRELGRLRRLQIEDQRRERALNRMQQQQQLQREQQQMERFRSTLGTLGPEAASRIGVPLEALQSVQSPQELQALTQLGNLMRPQPLDIEELTQSYLLKTTAGQRPTPQEEMAAQVFDKMKRSEVEYDPSTGRARPKYTPIYSGGAAQPALGVLQDDIGVEPLDVSQVESLLGGEAITEGQGAQGGGSQNTGEFVMPKPPKGLFPKAQLEWQTQAVKNEFQQRVDTKEKQEAQKQFESILANVASNYASLDDEGVLVDAPEVLSDYVLNPMKYLASTEQIDPWGVIPAGQDVGRFFGTKAQAKRDTINTQVPAMFAEIRKAAGLTGKELDNLRERDFYLQQLGKLTLPKNAIMEAIKSASERYGTGEVAGRIDEIFLNEPSGEAPRDVKQMSDEELLRIIQDGN